MACPYTSTYVAIAHIPLKSKFFKKFVWRYISYGMHFFCEQNCIVLDLLCKKTHRSIHTYPETTF